jgi:hypothetical protein
MMDAIKKWLSEQCLTLSGAPANVASKNSDEFCSSS